MILFTPVLDVRSTLWNFIVALSQVSSAVQNDNERREITHLLCKPGAHGRLSVQPAPTPKFLSRLTVVFIQQDPLKPILRTSLIWCVSGPTR